MQKVYLTCQLIFITCTAAISRGRLNGWDSHHAERRGSFYGAPKKRDFRTKFQTKDSELVILSDNVNYNDAARICKKNYDGHLAHINTPEKANFISEAMEETSLANSSAWIFAEPGDGASPLMSAEPVSGPVWSAWNNNKKAKEVHRPPTRAVSWSRSVIPSASISSQQILACKSPHLRGRSITPDFCPRKNPVVCETKHYIYPFTASVTRAYEGPTHPGWIRLDDMNKYCKIYAGRVTWQQASEKCRNSGAMLANPTSAADCTVLARFLKIGRPSISHAWISGKYDDKSKIFKYENGQKLSPSPNKNNFPPWRDGYQHKKSGCVALDRDTSTDPVFLPINCLRKRDYICCRDKVVKDDYITPEPDKDIESKSDVVIDEIGYRVYFQKLSWEQARNKCNSFKQTYGGQLAEVRHKATINYLLNAMGGLLKPIFNLWIGGRYDTNTGRWHWESDKAEIPPGGILNWVRNESFQAGAEKDNDCLNMDRVNGNEAEFYGTQCSWGQNFVCTFTRKQMEKLHTDENSRQ